MKMFWYVTVHIVHPICVYLLHIDCESDYFQNIFRDIECLLLEAWDMRYTVVIVRDLNLSLDQGVRDRI